MTDQSGHLDSDFRCVGEWIGEGSALVTVEGELDVHTSAQLRDVLKELDARGIAHHLIVDLSLCTFIDSTGLGLLVAVQRRADAPLDLVITDPQILDLLEITALDRLLRIHPDRPAAVDSLRKRIGEVCSIGGQPMHTGGLCG
jgi:anti-sigma B factor antagonist